jgi:hypothetical protein
LGGRTVPSPPFDQITDSERALDREVDDIAGSREVFLAGRTRTLTLEAQIECPVLVYDVAEPNRQPALIAEKFCGLAGEVSKKLRRKRQVEGPWLEGVFVNGDLGL